MFDAGMELARKRKIEREQKNVVSRELYNQVVFERDVALNQLAEIGKSLGQSMDDIKKIMEAHGG